MLGPALTFIAIVGLIATVAAGGIAAAARVTAGTLAQRALDAGVRQGIARYQTGIEAQIVAAAGAPAAAAPGANAVLANPAALGAATYAGTAGTFALTETVTPTTAATPACGPADGGGSDVAVDVQCSPWVQESRASLTVDVRVSTVDGRATLAERQVLVTLRLFATPPYTSVAGMKDGAAAAPDDGDAVDDPGTVHEDDTGGRNGAVLAPDASDPGAAIGAGDTAIHVQYQCLGPNCDRPRPPTPDHLTTRHWSNGNTFAP